MNGSIVFLGWAELAQGAGQGGGYNLIASEHAKYLAAQGRRVLYLQSGISFDFNRSSQKIKYSGDFRGIKCFSLYNSRNLAPAAYNHHNRESQITDEAQNELVCRWLNKQNAQAVYIHSLEGQALSLIAAIKKDASAKVAVIIHDHYYICPNVKLIKCGSTLCTDYCAGQDCEDCVEKINAKNYMLRMALKRFAILRFLKRTAAVFKRSSAAAVQVPISVPADPNDVLLNKISTEGSGFFAGRRRAGIAALNAADAVFSPSGFIASYLKKCGVSPDKLKVFRTGLPHLDELKKIGTFRAAAGSAEKPIRFCCFGSDLAVKGVGFFIDAIKNISPESAAKCKFIIKGLGSTDYWKAYARGYNNIEIQGRYTVGQIAGFASEYDIGVLPHLWFENSPVALLEHLAMKKPVLSADIGGVTDYIRAGANGWLFKAGNSASLTALIEDIASGRFEIPEIRKTELNSLEECMKEISI